jgi:hypothetical protein
MTSPLQRFKLDLADLEGFFTPLSQAAWDFLLACQNDMREPGSFYRNRRLEWQAGLSRGFPNLRQQY